MVIEQKGNGLPEPQKPSTKGSQLRTTEQIIAEARARRAKREAQGEQPAAVEAEQGRLRVPEAPAGVSTTGKSAEPAIEAIGKEPERSLEEIVESVRQKLANPQDIDKINEFEKEIDERPEWKLRKADLARFIEDTGDLISAEQIYKIALLENKGKDDERYAVEYYAEFLERTERFDQGRALWREYLNRNPSASVAWSYFADFTYAHNKSVEEAEQIYEEGRQKNPERSLSTFFYAHFMAENDPQNGIAKGIGLFEEFTSNYPKNTEAWNDFARFAYRYKRDPEYAGRIYELAEKHNPENTFIRLSHGRFLTENQQYEKAVLVFEKAIKERAGGSIEYDLRKLYKDHSKMTDEEINKKIADLKTEAEDNLFIPPFLRPGASGKFGAGE